MRRTPYQTLIEMASRSIRKIRHLEAVGSDEASREAQAERKGHDEIIEVLKG